MNEAALEAVHVVPFQTQTLSQMALPSLSRRFIGFSSSSSSFPAVLPAFPALSTSSLRLHSSARKRFAVSASLNHPAPPVGTGEATMVEPAAGRWRPMCLYYTQGKCTKMDDASHTEKFNHNFSDDLKASSASFDQLRPQNLDYLLVLDLEGRVEILEFPVIMIECKTMKFIDSFHRFVRPSRMSEQRINEYIEGKYGKMGVDRVWHDTAIPFNDVLQEFEIWMKNHQLWEEGNKLNGTAFVTCGNWDVKTKIPEQCKVSKIKLPPYFMEWINIKDVYLNFYKRRATGMKTMMNELEIPLLGSHHLGIDDTKNIARVLQRMLADGVLLQVTARRSSSAPHEVKFLFKNRIR